jgi:hypothetical protein
LDRKLRRIFSRGSVVRILSTLNFSGKSSSTSPNEIKYIWAGATKVTFDGFTNKADRAEFERQFSAGLSTWLSSNLVKTRDLMQEVVDYDPSTDMDSDEVYRV